MPYYLLTLHKIRVIIAKCVYIDIGMNAQTKKSSTDKMSQSGKIAKGPLPKRDKVLRLVALFLLISLFVLGVVANVIWYNRTSLAENQIRKFMTKNGYDITLNVQKLSKNQITIANIAISKDKNVFFKSAHTIVDYDLSSRKAQRIKLLNPYLKIKFDTKGSIISTWMMQNAKEAANPTVPLKGITIENAVIDWRVMQNKDTAIGEGQAGLSANIISKINWSANSTSTQSFFNSDALKGNVEHDIFIETKDGNSFEIFGSVNVEKLNANLLSLKNFRALSVDNTFKLKLVRSKKNEQSILSGWSEMRIRKLLTQDYSAEDVNLKLEQFNLSAGDRITANWLLKTNGMRIRDDDMRANLANKLTSHNAMANIPIAQFLTRPIYNKAERLLNGFTMNGQGVFASTDAGYAIHLEKSLDFKAIGQTVRFTQKSGNFIQYNKADSRFTLKGDMNWSGVQALQLTNFSLDANSTNGVKLDAVNNIHARIRSQKTWRLHNDGDDVRLAPFDVDFTYADLGNALRTVNLTGGVDFDGPVPGGTVLGMKATGKTSLRLQGRDFILGFTPSGPLLIGEFTNPSGWTAKLLAFTLEPQANLLSRSAKSSIMRTALTDVSAQIIGPADNRHLNAQFERLDVLADFTKPPQRWQVRISGTAINSEDFPAPGTHMISPTAALEINQSQNGQMNFEIISPVTRIATDNTLIENLQIKLNGSSDDIAMEYDAASVTMVGDDIPVLPMHGTARLKFGELVGQAITNLPHTKNTPINIQYRSKNGQGSAEILIPKIVFDPKGLQPQQLVPILRGKLAEVSGEVSAEFIFTFGNGQPVRSSGRAELKGLDIGTLVGPLNGVNSQLTFASIFPLQTEGIQTANLAEFDPGFLLKNGGVQFEIKPDEIKVHQAQWPIENIEGEAGKVFLTPMDWQFGNVENQVTVNVENVGLGTILAGIGDDKFTASGQVFGTLPTKIKGVDVRIKDGVLFVKGGGIIRYKSAATDAVADRNENAAYAFKALENFEYKQLEARIDGPLDGNMALKIVFDGQNSDVLSGQPFQFNTVVSGELANIARNLTGAFSNEENLSRIIDIQNNRQSDTP
jgi:Dicarboxylate transport